MKTSTPFRLVFLLIISCFSFMSFASITFYVSPVGNDKNRGTIHNPFLTLEKARDAIRELSPSKKKKAGGVTVFIRGGRYFMNKTFLLTPKDGGTQKAPILYSAYPGETPILSGGVVVKGWKVLEPSKEVKKKHQGKIWVANVEKEKIFHYLFVNGKRATRSTNQNNNDWRTWSHNFSFGKPEKEGQLIQFQDTNILANLPNNGDVEMMAIMRQYGVIGNGILTQLNPEKNSARWNSSQLNLAKPRNIHEKSYRLENALCLTDEPGEWAINTSLGKVYYYTRGENMATAEVIAPRLYKLIQLQGSEEKQEWVKYIEIKGLTLMMTDRVAENKWPREWLKRQWENVDAMIWMENVEHCKITGNRILHTGAYGVGLTHHALYNDIIGNEIAYTGSGGVELIGYGPGTKDVNRYNKVCFNYIHDQGLGNYWHSPGVQIYGSGSNTISYNFLSYSAYSSISIVGMAERDMNKYAKKNSWEGQVDTWEHCRARWEDFPKSMIDRLEKGEKVFTVNNFTDYVHSDSNIIEKNICYESQTKLNEGGVLYAWYTGKGNIYRKNLIYKNGKMPGSSVIAMDDRAEYALIEDNVVWVTGVILTVVGQRDYTRGTTIQNNQRVAFQYKNRSKMFNNKGWWKTHTGTEPFKVLFDDIMQTVNNRGGWMGSPNHLIYDLLYKEGGEKATKKSYFDESEIHPVM